MKISNVQVTRIKMPRADPTWRTASYAGNAVEGFLLQIHADGVTGLGGTAAHPRNISGDELEAQLTGPIRSALLGADPLSGNAIREIILKANVHSRASIAADLALYDVTGKLANLPCYALWGGAVPPRVRVVRMVGIKPPAELETAVGKCRSGNHALQSKDWNPPSGRRGADSCPAQCLWHARLGWH